MQKKVKHSIEALSVPAPPLDKYQIYKWTEELDIKLQRQKFTI